MNKIIALILTMLLMMSLGVEAKTAEEKAIWEEFSRTRSAQLRDELVMQYLPLIKYVVG